ncbi:MAG: hypothetical protein IJ507_03655 [Clostridia bacterium]|nr:hypothetical protein [Clostridia bacterium]
MYKLLLATDKPEIVAAYQAVPAWETLGFRAPRVVSTAGEALESLKKYHADAVSIALQAGEEQKLLDALLLDYPMLPITQAGNTRANVEGTVRELELLLNRTHADYSDDDTSEAEMMQLCRHEFFRALIGGKIRSKSDTLRYLKLLRSRMDPARSAVLVELAPSKDDGFLRGRWHYGVDRLEVALRNFFGAELEGMRVLVSVLPDDRIYLLCCTMLGEKGPDTASMAGLVTGHAQQSIDHVREYLDLHLSIASIRVLPTLTALTDI